MQFLTTKTTKRKDGRYHTHGDEEAIWTVEQDGFGDTRAAALESYRKHAAATLNCSPNEVAILNRAG